MICGRDLTMGKLSDSVIISMNFIQFVVAPFFLVFLPSKSGAMLILFLIAILLWRSYQILHILVDNILKNSIDFNTSFTCFTPLTFVFIFLIKFPLFLQKVSLKDLDINFVC